MGYQGSGCSASWVLFSTVLHSMNLWPWAYRKHWIPYLSLPPTHTLCSRLPLIRCVQAFLPYLIFSHAELRLLCYSFAGSVSFVLVLRSPLWRMSSNPLGLSSGTSSSRKPLLVSNPDWHKWHSCVFILLLWRVSPWSVVMGLFLSLLLDWNLFKNKLDVPGFHRVAITYWALHK